MKTYTKLKQSEGQKTNQNDLIKINNNWYIKHINDLQPELIKKS